MSKQDYLISMLRHQNESLSGLIKGLEQREVAMSEDYSLAECRIYQVIKGLKIARRTAITELLGEMINHKTFYPGVS